MTSKQRKRSRIAPAGGPPSSMRLDRAELMMLAGLLLAGIIFRAVAFGHSAVEHFDEGVYASNIYFGAPEYTYPLQRYYAPPLLPALIEAGMIVGLTPNFAALLPGFIAGCVTILALWWFGRSWFTPEVGLSAAALAALSDFHVGLSAAALTDVLLGLWVLLAVDAAARSLLGTDFRWAVGAGLYTGLAWWTKYNGWLPLPIEAAAIMLLWILRRPPAGQWFGWLSCFAITALVAAIVWSPYYFSLQSTGGYGPIATNHAKYVVGFSGWLDAAARQFANQHVLESLPSALGVAIAFAPSGFLPSSKPRDRIWHFAVGIVAGMLAILSSSFLVVGAGALVGLAQTTLAIRQPVAESRQREAIGLALVAAWWLGLLVATPLYTPYPRLVLPWLLAAWLGTALSCAGFLRIPDDALARQARHRWQTIAGLALLASLLLIYRIFWPHLEHVKLSTDRRGVQKAAQQIHHNETGGQPRAIYVYGEPALFFQLCASGEEIVAAVENVPSAPAVIDGQPISTCLAFGPHAPMDPQFEKQWEAAKDQWELVETYRYQPSPMVWLDLHDPQRPPKSSVAAVQLYRLRPQSKSP
jgi:dolichyl-phosphate-mannose-protein mannosyltransferase